MALVSAILFNNRSGSPSVFSCTGDEKGVRRKIQDREEQMVLHQVAILDDHRTQKNWSSKVISGSSRLNCASALFLSSHVAPHAPSLPQQRV
jgi:hypothetical protein